MKRREPIDSLPYQKIQYWDENVSAWMDMQHKFYSLHELIDYARDNLDMDLITRVVAVDEAGNDRICEHIDAFGITCERNRFDDRANGDQ